jgi:putative ABC transport system permease protein
MLTPRWQKVIRELWSNKTKTILVVLAITVGLFAFGSVFLTGDILVADMDNQYRAVNSSNITFTTSAFDNDLLRWVRQQPDVAEAQGRASNIVKMYSGDKTYNLTLIAFDDYKDITMNRVTPEKGTWPPGRREISFERTSLPLSQAQIGDLLTVEVSSGRKYELTITGTVHDLNAFPGNMVPLPTGYVSMQTLAWLGFSDQYNQMNIVTKANLINIPDISAVASPLRQQLEDRGLTIYTTLLKRSDEHWAKTVTQSFVLVLTFLGIFCLVLSAFLVINTITALISQQKRQIGMMKAIGGTGKQIISLYLVLVSFYGILALIVALPVSMVLGYLFIGMVAQLINIDIINFHMPWRVFFLEAGAALLIPAVSAAIPILNGVRISTREALSDYGISSKIRSGAFDRMLLKISFLSRPVLLSLRNTFRRKSRLALTLGTLILAGTIFISVMNVRDSLNSEFTKVFKKYWDWEVALGLDGDYPVKGIEARTMRISGVTGVDAQIESNFERVAADGSRGYAFRVTGVDPGSGFVQPNVKSGRWLQSGDRNVLVLTSALADDIPDVKVGDKILLRTNNQNKEWEIIGIAPQSWDKTAYADFTYLTRMEGKAGQTSSLYVRTAEKDGSAQAIMAQKVEDQLKKSGIKVGSSITQEAIVSSNAGQVDFLIYFLLIMAFMSAAIGALGLMGMMSLNVLERTREIGVMRSIGAASRAVGSVVIIEGLIIGIVSWLVAIPLSFPISLVFNSMLGGLMFGGNIPLVFSPAGLIIWFFIVTVMAFAASLLPAFRAMRMSIRETLAYE